jgi:hypothetical protein
MVSELWGLSLRRWDVWGALFIGMVFGGLLFQTAYYYIKRIVERRTAWRRWGNPVGVLVDGICGGPLRGLVVNRSQGGVGMVVDKAFDKGTQLRIRVEGAPKEIPWVPVEVRHCRSAGRNWLIGCKFLEPVSWNTFVWFG